MPRQPPEECARYTYSKDLRERVVYQRYKLKKKITAIAIDLNISQRVVERTLELWRNTGDVIPEGLGLHGKRQKLMTPHEIEVYTSLVKLRCIPLTSPQFLVELVGRYPDLYIDEMQEHLLLQHGIVVGITTIWNALTEIGINHKKVSRPPFNPGYSQISGVAL